MMKKYIFFLSCLLFLFSCGKSTKITYPETGEYGQNVLSGDSELNITDGTYSFAADLPQNASLEVRFSITFASGAWTTDITKVEGWDVGKFQVATQTQTFTAQSNHLNDLEIDFSGSGRVIVEYFENGSTSPTLSKAVEWN